MLNKIKSHLYVLQLLEYDPDRFVHWLFNKPFFFPKEKKGRLGWSFKARLLYSAAILIQLIISILISLSPHSKTGGMVNYLWDLGFFMISNFILYFVPAIPLILALLVLTPFEYLFTFYLSRKAADVIKKHKNLKVVGVTGSFGKTSVKEILAQILSKKFRVVATPESYNKKLSVAQTILNKVKPDTEIFIAEMGAYHSGEISEISRVVKPQIGIITGITNQHLERFGSVENIKRAKNELIEALPQNGYALFNLDNEETRELYDKCLVKKDGYDLKETKSEIKKGATFFNLFGKEIRTSLLGKHNVLNIIGAVKAALYLGLSQDEIIERIGYVQPVPHRLELIRGDNEALIIDDAYSSNLEGYKAAFNLVKDYQNYPKVLVTPGLVELGQKQKEENRQMALTAANLFDYVIIVNLTNRTPLMNGLLERGWILYNPGREETPEKWQLAYEGIKKDKIIFVAYDLNEATQEIFPKISRSGSLILIENDLPDIYR